MILYTIVTRPKELQRGFFYCPGCRLRCPGVMMGVEQRLYFLGFIPMGSIDPLGSKSESPIYLVCHTCANLFDEADDFPYDFGDHAEHRKWECRRCGAENTNDVYHCRKCGRHV